MSNGLDFFISADGSFPTDAAPDDYAEGEHLLHNRTLHLVMSEAPERFEILNDAWDCKDTFISHADVPRLRLELELMLAATLSVEAHSELVAAIALCGKAELGESGILISGP